VNRVAVSRDKYTSALYNMKEGRIIVFNSLSALLVVVLSFYATTPLIYNTFLKRVYNKNSSEIESAQHSYRGQKGNVIQEKDSHSLSFARTAKNLGAKQKTKIHGDKNSYDWDMWVGASENIFTLLTRVLYTMVLPALIFLVMLTLAAATL